MSSNTTLPKKRFLSVFGWPEKPSKASLPITSQNNHPIKFVKNQRVDQSERERERERESTFYFSDSLRHRSCWDSVFCRVIGFSKHAKFACLTRRFSVNFFRFCSGKKPCLSQAVYLNISTGDFWPNYIMRAWSRRIHFWTFSVSWSWKVPKIKISEIVKVKKNDVTQTHQQKKLTRSNQNFLRT